MKRKHLSVATAAHWQPIGSSATKCGSAVNDERRAVLSGELLNRRKIAAQPECSDMNDRAAASLRERIFGCVNGKLPRVAIDVAQHRHTPGKLNRVNRCGERERRHCNAPLDAKCDEGGRDATCCAGYERGVSPTPDMQT
jgi:hypothetical protein